MQDLATTTRRAFVAQLDANDADSVIARMARRNAMKRRDAIQYLGSRWVFHPRYHAASNAHHAPAHKESAVLAHYIAVRRAHAAGRLPVTHPQTAVSLLDAYEQTACTDHLWDVAAA